MDSHENGICSQLESCRTEAPTCPCGQGPCEAGHPRSPTATAPRIPEKKLSGVQHLPPQRPQEGPGLRAPWPSTSRNGSAPAWSPQALRDSDGSLFFSSLGCLICRMGMIPPALPPSALRMRETRGRPIAGCTFREALGDALARPQRAKQSASREGGWQRQTLTACCSGPPVPCVPAVSHVLACLCPLTWLAQLLGLYGGFCTFCHRCEISIFQASWP